MSECKWKVKTTTGDDESPISNRDDSSTKSVGSQLSQAIANMPVELRERGYSVKGHATYSLEMLIFRTANQRPWNIWGKKLRDRYNAVI